jgi:hypothetical protein
MFADLFLDCRSIHAKAYHGGRTRAWQNRKPEHPYITNLKCNYRPRIVRDGYALARSELALFKPEA